MGILDEIKEKSTWEKFLEYKKERGLLSKREIKELTAFIDEDRFIPVAEAMSESGYSFPPPRRISINRKGSGKKRTVYSFDSEITNVLKLIAFLLYRYDSYISDRCYSFRRNMNAKTAVRDILSVPKDRRMYFYKTDIHDYFNSIPNERLADQLDEVITDDEEILALLRSLLLQERCVENGETISCRCGAMAGVPVSAFFADIYLKRFDELFSGIGADYFRYSDDILIFAPSLKKLQEYIDLTASEIEKYGLELNREKEQTGGPGEEWEYLGFRSGEGKVRLSSVSKSKIKAKIKRKAHALYRWRKRKNVDFEKTAAKMISIFNRKFYDDRKENGFTWSRWYFPVITDVSDLKEIDAYLIENIRYLSSGRYYKGNYRVRYEDIKKLGFRSLVNEYYKYIKSGEV